MLRFFWSSGSHHPQGWAECSKGELNKNFGPFNAVFSQTSPIFGSLLFKGRCSLPFILQYLSQLLTLKVGKVQAIFMFFQIFAYALRPMFIKPDLVPLDGWVLCNFLAPWSTWSRRFKVTLSTWWICGVMQMCILIHMYDDIIWNAQKLWRLGFALWSQDSLACWEISSSRCSEGLQCQYWLVKLAHKQWYQRPRLKVFELHFFSMVV